jgi:hypothetical protein
VEDALKKVLFVFSKVFRGVLPHRTLNWPHPCPIR